MNIDEFLKNYRTNFEAYSLMFGGTLEGVEGIWHTLYDIEKFVAGQDDTLHRDAYRIIAQKYKCGSWALCGKVESEYTDETRREASEELIRRLNEVHQLEIQMRKDLEKQDLLEIKENPLSNLLEENEKLKKRLKPIELDELSHYLIQDRLYFVMKLFKDITSNNAIINSTPKLIELITDITYKFRDLTVAIDIVKNKKDVQES